MRKIIVLSFISLDGVMQAPGGPEEDNGNNFKFGGWTVPFSDEESEKIMTEQMGKPFDMLLGRKTFDIFASYWPEHDNEIGDPINNATKYVVSKSMKESQWQKSIFINDNVVEELKKIKESDGPDLQVHGSGNLIQTLLKNDLVDELWLKTFPVILGSGKRLFEDGITPSSFKLTDSKITQNGVIFANYIRDGEVKTGSFE